MRQIVQPVWKGRSKHLPDWERCRMLKTCNVLRSRLRNVLLKFMMLISEETLQLELLACLGDYHGCEWDIVRQIHLACMNTWAKNSYQSHINIQATKKWITVSHVASHGSERSLFKPQAVHEQLCLSPVQGKQWGSLPFLFPGKFCLCFSQVVLMHFGLPPLIWNENRNH